MPRIIVKNFIQLDDGTSDMQLSFSKAIEEKFKGMIDFEYLNAKSNESQVMKYRIRDLPTIIIECDGREKERFIGLTQQLFLKKAIERVLSEMR